MSKYVDRRSVIVPVLSIFTWSGCGSVGTEPVEESEVVALEVSPTTARLVSVGDSVSFSAAAVLSDGSRQPTGVMWSTRDPAIVTISDMGWAIARADGVVTLDASRGSLMASARVVVHPDTTGPALFDVFVDRNVVEVFQRTQEVLVTVRLDDRGSGTKSALCVFDSPFGTGINGLVPLERVEGSDTTLASGVTRTLFQGLLEIPWRWAGTWSLTLLEAEDALGNTSRWGLPELEDLDLEVEILAVFSGDAD